jgi:hypothetical protein
MHYDDVRGTPAAIMHILKPGLIPCRNLSVFLNLPFSKK